MSIPTIRRGKYVTLACALCKNAKTKCSGTQPCTRCVGKNYTCIYPEEGDGRKRFMMRRRLEQLERENEILTGVIKTIQDAEEPEIGHIVALVRSGGLLEVVEHDSTQQSNAAPDRQLMESGPHSGEGSLSEGLSISSSQEEEDHQQRQRQRQRQQDQQDEYQQLSGPAGYGVSMPRSSSTNSDILRISNLIDPPPTQFGKSGGSHG